MLTKNAIGNLLNRYHAVLKNCHLANTFGSLALAGAVLLGITTLAQAADITSSFPSGEGWHIEETQTGQTADFTVDGKGYIIDITGTSDTMAVTIDADGNKNIAGTFLKQEEKDVAAGKDANGNATEAITYTVYGGAVRLFCDAENKVFENPPFQQVKIVDGQTNVDINNITGAFVGNSANKLYREYDVKDGKDFYASDGHFAMGGALFNQRNIESINADFVGNSVSTEDSYTEAGHGGAIMHMYGHIGSITGDFIANTADGTGGAISMSNPDSLSNNQHLGVGYHGGTIYVYELDPMPELASIGTITGDFIANTAKGVGGALYLNNNEIESITGDFIGNSALDKNVPDSGSGGAIYAAEGRIREIKGNFRDNTTGGAGGAICWVSGSRMGTIIGDFENNRSVETGGAIHLYGKIEEIQGNFTNNSSGEGGAINIFGNGGGWIGHIQGDFKENHAERGGAILFEGGETMFSSLFESDFIGNSATGSGGALYYNDWSEGGLVLDGNFKNNHAGDQGGAIYAVGKANFLAKDNTNTFSGNYVLEDDGSKHYNALYLEGGEANFVMQGTGGFVMNDTIEGNGYAVHIQGEDADNNIFTLNNAIFDAYAIYLQDTTLRLGTATHDNVEYKGKVGDVNSSLSGADFFLAERVKLENDLTSNNEKVIVVGNDWDSPTLMPNSYVTFTDGKTISVETGGSLTVAGGLLDIANGTLKADIDPSNDPSSLVYDKDYDPNDPPVFQTSGSGSLRADASNFGVFDLTKGSFEPELTNIKKDITNDGNLTLTGLSGNVSLDNYKRYLDTSWLVDDGTLTLEGVTIVDGSGKPYVFEMNDLPDGFGQDVTAKAGKIGTYGEGSSDVNKNVRIQSIAQGLTEQNQAVVSYGSTLTLTGGGQGVTDAVFSDNEDITNKGTLYIGFRNKGTLKGNLDTVLVTLDDGTTEVLSETHVLADITVTGNVSNSGITTFYDKAHIEGDVTTKPIDSFYTGMYFAKETTIDGSLILNGSCAYFEDKATVDKVAFANNGYGEVHFEGKTDIDTIDLKNNNAKKSSQVIFYADSTVDTMTVQSGEVSIYGATDEYGRLTGEPCTVTVGNLTVTDTGRVNVNSDGNTHLKVTGDLKVDVEKGGFLSVGYGGQLTASADDFGTFDLVNGTFDNTGASVVLGVSNGSYNVGINGNLTLTGLDGDMTLEAYGKLLEDAKTDYLIENGTLTLAGVTIDGVGDGSGEGGQDQPSLDDIPDNAGLDEKVKAGTVEEGKTVQVAGVTGSIRTVNNGVLTLTGKTEKNGGVGTLAEGDIENNDKMILGSEGTAAQAVKTKETEELITITNNKNATTTTKGKVSLGNFENYGTLNVEGDTTIATLTNKKDLVVTGSAKVTELITEEGASISVGNNDKKGSFSAGKAKLAGSSIFLDPIWENGVIEGASNASLGFADATVDGYIVVGRNSYAVLGSGSADELTEAEAAFKKHGLTWGKNDITAALFLNEAYEVADSAAGLTVDGSLTAAPSTNTAGATFANQSLLAVDADGLTLSNSAALTADTITAVQGANLLIISKDLDYDADGEATVTIAKADTKLDVADGAWGYNDAENKETIFVNSHLMEVESVALANDTYTVTVSKASGGLPGMDDDLAALIASGDTDANPFLADAVDPSKADAVTAATSIEGATKAGHAAGIGAGLNSINIASTNNVYARLDTVAFSDKDTSSMLAMNGDGAIVPMNGKQEGLGVWFMPMYKHTKANGFESGSYDYGFNTDLYGATLGADYTFASALRLGLAFNVGTGESDSTGDFDGTSNDFDYFGLTGYASMSFGNLGLYADLGYTASANDIDQDNYFGHLSTETDADLISAGLKADYKIAINSINVTPYAGVRLNYYSVDGYDTKYFDSSVINADSSDYTIIEFPVGLTLDTTLNAGDWDITPSAGLGVKFAAGDLDADQRISFSGLAGSATVSSEVADEVTFQGALGLGFAKDAYSIDLGYTLDLSENLESHGLNVNLRYEF